MKFLVLEKNNAVIRIYRKLFNQKNYEVDFVISEEECFDNLRYHDYVIFDYCYTSQRRRIEERFEKIKPEQKILFLPKPSNQKEDQQISKETKDLIQKPFAMVGLLAKIELKATPF